MVLLWSAWRDISGDGRAEGAASALRAIGQKDPLLEYQFESYNLFQGDDAGFGVLCGLAQVAVVTEGGRSPRRISRGTFVSRFWAGTGEDAVPSFPVRTVEPIRRSPRVGRNDPCLWQWKEIQKALLQQGA